jgi:hypothetical protein
VLERLRRQPAPREVRARLLGLGRVPQDALVVGRRAVEQLVEPPLAFAALGVARVLLLELELDPVPVGEQLDRRLEVDALGLHDEVDRRAALVAAEAEEDLLGGVDAERRRPLVVERAERHEARRTGPPDLGARADEVAHVDRVADPLDRLLCVAGHA